MLEIKKTELPLKIGEKEFSLKSPTYKDSLNYESALKDAGDDSALKAECLFKYLEVLGLPQEESTTLDIDNLLKIIDYVSGSKKK